MSTHKDEALRALLKGTLPPVTDAELPRDLWPRMLRRLDEGSVPVPWFDWTLAALALGWFLLNPRVIPVLLYHL